MRALRAHWRRIVATLLVAIAAAYFGASYYIADRLTSDYPRAPIDRAPAVAAPSYENVSFRTSDGLTLRGWFFPVSTDRAVILIAGRTDDRTWNGNFERIAEFLVGAGYSVLMFDLRGHGSSDGGRYTMGYFERYDIAAAIEHLTARGFAEKRIALVGISMGAASTISALALHPGVGPVVVESAYTDLAAVMGETLPRKFGVPGAMAPGMLAAARVAWGIDTSQVRPLDVVKAYPDRDFLFIHCTDDDWVLPWHGDALRAANRGPGTEMWTPSGCAHAESWQFHPDEYRAHVLAYLAKEF